MSEWEQQVQRWLSGEADETDMDLLRQALNDPGQRDAMLALCAEQRALRNALGGGVDVEEAIRQMQRQRWRKRWFATLWAAVLVIGSSLVALWLMQQPADLRVIAIDGVASRIEGDHRQPLGDGDLLAYGTRLEAVGGTVSLRHAHGLEARLSNGELILEERGSWLLQRGQLHVEAAPGAAAVQLTIDTPHARCRITGTIFTLKVVPSGSLVQVERGSVQWHRPGQPPQTVGPGSLAHASPPQGMVEVLGFDFARGTVAVSGLLAPGPRLTGLEDGVPTPRGLLVERSDFIRWQQRLHPGHIPLLPLLRSAERVRLSARVRFHTDAPFRCSIGVLQCLAPATGLERHLPLRWWQKGQRKSSTWHEVSVVMDRSGTRRSSINGFEMQVQEGPWPFDQWTSAINLLIHTHKDPPNDPVDIEYDWVRLSIE